jgi:CRISPR-associated protein Cas5d
MEERPLEVHVWGEYACFTRPEYKTERVTYPVMTPSAARGVLEAIFWKPEFVWEIQEIVVLAPIRYFSILRNEILGQQSHHGQQQGAGGFFAEERRVQRHTLGLRDVDYIIRASMRLKPHAQVDVAKYRDQFRRRVAHGRYFQHPYLGLREFPAHFAAPTGHEQPISDSMDLGRVFFDQAFVPDEAGPIQFRVPGGTGSGWTSGFARAFFFAAALQTGVLSVPASLYKELQNATARVG